MTTPVASRVASMPSDVKDRQLTRMLERQEANPANIGFPPTLPIELALAEKKPSEICAAYGITRGDYEVLVRQPVFQKAFQEAREQLKVEGMSFKFKARMQAEAFLAVNFQMVNDPNTSDAVRAKLIGDTARWAGFDQKAVESGNGGSTFAIQINLG